MKISYALFSLLAGIILTVQLHSQDISFSPPSTLSELQEADAGSMDLGDIDGDGDMDLVIIGNGSISAGGMRSTLYLNDGTGLFTEIEDAGLIGTMSGEARFLDIDNDDDLDMLIIASISSFSSASLYLNDGTGDFTLVEDSGIRPSRGGGFDYGDVDGDGDLDVIVTGTDLRFISGTLIEEAFTGVFLNDGNGAFTEVMNVPFEALNFGKVRFIDMENDGDLDVVLAGDNADGMVSTTVYENDGTGTFELIADDGITDLSGGGLSVADSDGDGDMDILISGGGSSPSERFTHLFVNDGNGSFLEMSGNLTAVGGGSATEFADMDNDGDQDVLIFGLTDTGIVGEVFENIGNNVYMEVDTMYGSYISSLTTGDIDGDGDADFLVSGTTFDPIYPTPRTTRVFFNDFVSTVSVSELAMKRVQVYPNPSEGMVFFNVPDEMGEEWQLRVYDGLGRLVLSQNGLAHRLRGTLDLTALSEGSYMMHILSEDIKAQSRIVIQR